MKETMYLVKDIEFDITDGGNSEDEWTYEEYESQARCHWFMVC